MNIVLDTNTVISGLFWKGAPRQVLDLARSGTFTLFTSPDLLAELGKVLERPTPPLAAFGETSRPILPIQADFLLLQHAENWVRTVTWEPVVTNLRAQGVVPI